MSGDKKLRTQTTLKRLMVMAEAFERDKACQYLAQTCKDAARLILEMEAQDEQ